MAVLAMVLVPAAVLGVSPIHLGAMALAGAVAFATGWWPLATLGAVGLAYLGGLAVPAAGSWVGAAALAALALFGVVSFLEGRRMWAWGAAVATATAGLVFWAASANGETPAGPMVGLGAGVWAMWASQGSNAGSSAAVAKTRSSLWAAWTSHRMSAGSSAAVAETMSSLRAARGSHGSRAGAHRRGVGALVAGVALVGVAIGVAGWSGPVRAPAWHVDLDRFARASAAYREPAALGIDDEAMVILERLAVAGVGGAAELLAAVALAHNADPTRLRQVCPARDEPSRLDERWRDAVATGAAACGLAGGRVASSELGGAACALPGGRVVSIEPGAVAGLRRLVADLAMEVGELDGAIATYRAAADAGDPFALRDASWALLQRNRAAWAERTAPAGEPLVLLGVDPSWSGDAAWAAWNEAMDFSRLEPPSRRGVFSADAPGTLLSGVLTEDGGALVRATRVRTRYATRFALALPLPPTGAVPSVLRLYARERRGLELGFLTTTGRRLTYTCDPFRPRPGERVLPLPAPMCGGAFARAELRPAAALSGAHLPATALSGAHLPSAALPTADSPDARSNEARSNEARSNEAMDARLHELVLRGDFDIVELEGEP